MKATKKNITAAILKETGYTVEVEKLGGFLYWVDPINQELKDCCCTFFEDSFIGLQYLYDMTLERWVDDFKYVLNYNEEHVLNGRKAALNPEEVKVIKL